jgi:hypothetical protein
VTAFFEIYAGHNRQIDGPSQIDQVRIALILDIHLPLLFLFIRALIGFVLVLFVVATFS